jgi:uncharacterized protein (DUF934 family)
MVAYFLMRGCLEAAITIQVKLEQQAHYMPDQVFYLSRVGVNAFNPEKIEDLPAVLAHLNDFSVKYQNSIN